MSFISRDPPGKWYSFKSVNEDQPIYISNHFTWQQWNDKLHNETINYTPNAFFAIHFFTSTVKAFYGSERERKTISLQPN